MEKEKYISPDSRAVSVETAVTIAATSGNITDFDNNQLQYEEE